MSKIVKPGHVIIDFTPIGEDASAAPRIMVKDFILSTGGVSQNQAVIDVLNKTRGAIAKHIKQLEKKL